MIGEHYYWLRRAVSVLVGAGAASLAGGEWSAGAVISCALPSPPSNGLIVSSSTSPNGVTVFACNKGYKLMGSSVTVCLTNGNLSNPAPTCARVSCSLLTHPRNGSVSPGDDNFETIRNYTCNDGFKLVGFAITTCLFNGIWSSPQPTCQLITCPATPLIANGYFNTAPSSFTIGGTANTICLPGYQRTGAAVITCDSSGQWPTRDSLPSCKLISCALPSPPSNGSIVSSSTSPNGVTIFACNKGYILTGSSVAVCLTNGNLSNPAPTCARVSCSFLAHPQNGSVSPGDNNFEAMRNFTCNEGFKLVGFATITCLLQGVWSAPQPTCQRVTCSFLTHPQNGSVSPGDNNFEAIRNFTCNEGFELVGFATITCLLQGVWSASQPICQRVSCPLLTHDQNGSVSPGHNSFKAIRNYTCDEGFKLVGFATITCLLQGVWSAPQPTCQRVSCSFLTHPRNGSVSPGDNGFEAIRNFTCNEGFNLVGVATITCLLQGVWSAPQPTCQPIETCPALRFENGITPTTITRAGHVVKVECNVGYQINGSSSIICLSNGQWSGTPHCTGIPTAAALTETTWLGQSSSRAMIIVVSVLSLLLLSMLIAWGLSSSNPKNVPTTCTAHRPNEGAHRYENQFNVANSSLSLMTDTTSVEDTWNNGPTNRTYGEVMRFQNEYKVANSSLSPIIDTKNVADCEDTYDNDQPDWTYALEVPQYQNKFRNRSVSLTTDTNSIADSEDTYDNDQPSRTYETKVEHRRMDSSDVAEWSETPTMFYAEMCADREGKEVEKQVSSHRLGDAFSELGADKSCVVSPAINYRDIYQALV
ncbi:P-selectin-like [Sycon ciliatum]|uniref:P-selectin-like n=1 Tax=Sycon ciliatum TaxID=27933 RepID=UPI0031F6B9B3